MMAARGTLARRLVVGFLAVTVPGTLVLGAVTLYSIRSLAAAVRQLEEITLSLQSTQDLQLALDQATTPLQDYLLRGGQWRQQEFDRLIGVAQRKMISCASAACHGASRTPGEMAGLLVPTIEWLRAQGRLIFERAPLASDSARLLQVQEIDQLVSGTSQQLQRMSAALLVRVGALRQQAGAVSRQASVLTGGLTLAIVMLACAVAIIIANRISRPIQELLLGTRRIMAGNWGYRVRVG
ncbi:MAG: hypothetical protein HYV08_09540, partial [Deltaproteobacteria bacterium]|nr:hypothetical protein [Deltaproteobacteria bacterium]